MWEHGELLILPSVRWKTFTFPYCCSGCVFTIWNFSNFQFNRKNSTEYTRTIWLYGKVDKNSNNHIVMTRIPISFTIKVNRIRAYIFVLEILLASLIFSIYQKISSLCNQTKWFFHFFCIWLISDNGLI